MTHEKVIKREDGKQVKLRLDLYMVYGKPVYKCSVYTKDKGKRIWNGVYNDDYIFRKIPVDESEAFILEKQLLHVTHAEILAAKLELWEKIKPC